MFGLILLVFAFVLLAVAAAMQGWPTRLACAGLACWVLAEILTRSGVH